jgi:hypothetical protein
MSNNKRTNQWPSKKGPKKDPANPQQKTNKRSRRKQDAPYTHINQTCQTPFVRKSTVLCRNYGG